MKIASSASYYDGVVILLQEGTFTLDCYVTIIAKNQLCSMYSKLSVQGTIRSKVMIDQGLAACCTRGQDVLDEEVTLKMYMKYGLIRVPMLFYALFLVCALHALTCNLPDTGNVAGCLCMFDPHYG